MNTKIFIGRENELEQFRRTMDTLIPSPKSGEYYANTILIYGFGGMGKTELCRKFLEIAKTKYPEVVQTAINWLDKKEGCSFTPIELVDIFSDELKDKFPKEMKPYFDIKSRIRTNKEKIETLLERDKDLIDTTKPVISAAVTAVTGQPSIGPVVSEGFASFGKSLSNEFKKRLKKRWNVSDEELQLYEKPETILVKYLLQCITTITSKRKKKILIVLDTCELIRRSEAWLMDYFLVPLADNNPNVVLIYSGRDNAYTLHTVTIDGQTKKVYGFADKLTSHRPIAIDMKLFSEVDIRNYLRKKLEQEAHEEMIHFVNTFARGVPYAVDLLTNAMQNMGIESLIEHFYDVKFQKRLERSSSNEDIIKTVVDRFLFYCNQEDLTKIYALAILPDRNPDVLKEIWQGQNPADILEKLQSKYALFVGYAKLHDVVQEFLVEHLLRNQPLREGIGRSIAEKALPIYHDIYQRECEEEPDWEDRFEELRWRKAVQDLMNILIWKNPSDAVDFFLDRTIELMLFDEPFIHTLKKPLDNLLGIKVEPPLISRKRRRQVNALMEVVDTFSWRSFSEKLFSFCQKALDEWELTPVHRSILTLIKGRMQYQQNDYDAALNTLLLQCDETVLEKSLKDKLAEALDALGQKFCLDGKNNFFFSEKALKAFEKVIQLNDRKNSYLYHFAVMLRQNGQAEKALPYYSKSLEFDPTSEYVWKSQGLAFCDLGRYEDAIAAYQKAVEINPEYAIAHDDLGDVYRDLGRYEDAIAAYLKAIELDPKYATAHKGLGDVYRDLGRYEDAIAAYLKALEIDPKSMYAYSELADLYTDIGEFEKAYEVYAKASAIDPENSGLGNILGNIHTSQGKFAKAIESYEVAIEMNPPILGPLYNNIGGVYSLMGQCDKAVEWYKKACEHNSTHAYTGLGCAYLVLGDSDRAESALLKAIQIQRDNSAEPKIGLALTYLHLEKEEQARQYFTKVVEFCDSNKRIESQLHKVIALFGLQSFDEALKLLKQLAEKFTIGPVMAKDCLSDLELLASAPHPPEGIQQFLERAQEILGVN
ncbi:MAG: tetratricopeptide repeat protein [Methanophagales archaeon]|nr:tetratricopeptide repeat protein [Methanophagales archaeon]